MYVRRNVLQMVLWYYNSTVMHTEYSRALPVQVLKLQHA
jgi:hypothetical protein